MNDKSLPLTVDLTELLPPDRRSNTEDGFGFDKKVGVFTSALIVAQSGVLSINDVAAVLRCSVDTVRRIPMDELASYDGPGRGILYKLEDVQDYLWKRKRHRRRGSGLGQPVPGRTIFYNDERNLAADALKDLDVEVLA